MGKGFKEGILGGILLQCYVAKLFNFGSSSGSSSSPVLPIKKWEKPYYKRNIIRDLLLSGVLKLPVVLIHPGTGILQTDCTVKLLKSLVKNNFGSEAAEPEPK